MKKLGLILILSMLAVLPCCADETTIAIDSSNKMPKIFRYHIPDVEEVKEVKETGVIAEALDKEVEPVKQDIVSDDITADTSGNIEEEEESESEDIFEITDEQYDYNIDDMYSDVVYSDVLYGYAAYDEEEDEDTVSLEDSLDKIHSVTIQQPYNVKAGKYLADKNDIKKRAYSRYNNMEYNISPMKYSEVASVGKFSTGTSYEQKIDTNYAELRQSTSVYSRYDTKYFGLQTEFSKTLCSTNGSFNDYFSIAPELKLSQYISLKENLSANFAKNIKIAEFVVSINPFGKKDIDRFNIELGTSSVFDQNNSLIKNRLKFDTKFKL